MAVQATPVVHADACTQTPPKQTAVRDVGIQETRPLSIKTADIHVPTTPKAQRAIKRLGVENVELEVETPRESLETYDALVSPQHIGEASLLDVEDGCEDDVVHEIETSSLSILTEKTLIELSQLD